MDLPGEAARVLRAADEPGIDAERVRGLAEGFQDLQ